MEGLKKYILRLLSLACLVAIFLFAGKLYAQNDILINEIMYNPRGPDTNNEWLELKNLSNQDIDLTGYKLNDGSNHVLNKPPKKGSWGKLILPANGFLIIAQDAQNFRDKHPNVAVSIIDSSFSLKNSNATIKIIDPEKVTVATVNYNSNLGGNGDGATLIKTGAGWKSSPLAGGSPGQENINEEQKQGLEKQTERTASETEDFKTSPEIKGLRAEAGPDITALVNQKIEFNASASGSNLKYIFWNFGDGSTITGKQNTIHSYKFPGVYIVSLTVGDGSTESTDICTVTIFGNYIKITEFLPYAKKADKENEWIEIYNESDTPFNMEGWMLDDAEKGSKPFVFSKNSIIGGNSYLVFPRAITKIALNNNGDSVRLLFPTGSVAQEVKYDKAKKGQSAAVYDNGSFYWTDFNTPGYSNFPEINIKKIKNENLSYQKLRPVKVTNFWAQKIDLVPIAMASQVKEDSRLASAWQQASNALSDNKAPAEKEFLQKHFSQRKKALSVKQKSRLLYGSFSKNNPPLIILLISLFLSLSLFSFWFLRFVKK